MANIVKTVLSEIEKWDLFSTSLFIINAHIQVYYDKISFGNYEDKKKNFNILHDLKMIKHYRYLNIYHNNVKKELSNEKKLCYFESILVAKGYDLEKW